MKAIVIGGGAAATNVALTLLEKGVFVEMWDVGKVESNNKTGQGGFLDLKNQHGLEKYLLGENLDGIISPVSNDLFRIPPNREFISRGTQSSFYSQKNSFFPTVSFAKGGLANGWGANVGAYKKSDITDWILDYDEISPYYQKIYSKIAVTKGEDLLSDYLDTGFESQDPVSLSLQDQILLNSSKNKINKTSAILLGRARLAITNDNDSGQCCDQCGCCVWGCHKKSIYNPLCHTIALCEQYKAFKYVDGRKVIKLGVKDENINSITYYDYSRETLVTENIDSNVYLSAGALSSGAIYSRSLQEYGASGFALVRPILDTPTVKIPFLNVRALGTRKSFSSIQFNRLAMAVLPEGKYKHSAGYIHGEVLNLSSLMYHPLIESLGFGTILSKEIFFKMFSSLGVVTLFFSDDTSPEKTLITNLKSESVNLNYELSSMQSQLISDTVSRVKRYLLSLGCLPRKEIHYPNGGGIHYAGTIPMGVDCDKYGKSYLFRNLYIADSSAFPSLPSKPITINSIVFSSYVADNSIKQVI